MMNKNRRRHKVLSILVETHRKEWDYAPYNGAEYFFKINDTLKFGTDRLYADCLALVENGDAIKDHDEEYLDMFTVTDRGKYSYYDNVYLNRIWWRNKDFYIYVLSLSISVASLVVSIIALLKSD